MEFCDVGKHCAFVGCNQFDFLPFNCDACKKSFCLDHRTYLSHECPLANHFDRTVPTCPLCGSIISIGPGDDIDEKIDDHIASGCQQEGGRKSNPCSFLGCDGGELVKITCRFCKKNHCLKHRAPLDHGCEQENKKNEKKKEPKTQEKENKTLQSRQKKDRLIHQRIFSNSKREPLDAPKGTERSILLSFHFPLFCKKQGMHMMINTDWTVGRLIDYVAEKAGVRNNNNKPGAEKLNLFIVKTKHPLETSKSLTELLRDGTVRQFDYLLLDFGEQIEEGVEFVEKKESGCVLC